MDLSLDVIEDVRRELETSQDVSLRPVLSIIHHVEGSRFDNQLVEQIDFVVLAVADMDKRRDIASQIQKRVQLDSSFGGTERCPRKHRQAQIDGSGIESVNGVFQVDSKRLLGIEPSRHCDQTLCEIAVDSPVARCVGIGQSVARYRAAKPQVIELGGLRVQTGFDIAQALAKGHCVNAIDRY
jgi:hypothetical protein